MVPALKFLSVTAYTYYIIISLFSMQDKATEQVVIRGQPSCVRNIMVKDETDELEVALWCTSAESTSTLGDWVQISNFVLEGNPYHSQPLFASTQTTNVTVSSYRFLKTMITDRLAPLPTQDPCPNFLVTRTSGS